MEIQAQREDQVPYLLTANQGITDIEVYVQNQKEINEILILALTDNQVFEQEIYLTILAEIASQCPLLGGSAVYEARALLMIVRN